MRVMSSVCREGGVVVRKKLKYAREPPPPTAGFTQRSSEPPQALTAASQHSEEHREAAAVLVGGVGEAGEGVLRGMEKVGGVVDQAEGNSSCSKHGLERAKTIHCACLLSPPPARRAPPTTMAGSTALSAS